jgi:hypothetical protein
MSMMKRLGITFGQTSVLPVRTEASVVTLRIVLALKKSLFSS